MEFFPSGQENSFTFPCSTEIAHTQQGAVTEHSPALQQKAHKEETIVLLPDAPVNTGYSAGKNLIVLPIKSLISQGFLSQGALKGQSELELCASSPGV